MEQEKGVIINAVIFSQHGNTVAKLNALNRPQVGDLWELAEILDGDDFRQLDLTERECLDEFWQISHVIVNLASGGKNEQYTVYGVFTKPILPYGK